VLERRKAALTTRLADIRGRLSSHRERADTYTLSLMRHGMDATERDILWVDDLIEAERKAARRRVRPKRAKKEPAT
jgi:hypothetical protein